MEEDKDKMLKRKKEISERDEMRNEIDRCLEKLKHEMISERENMKIYENLKNVIKEVNFSVLDSEALLSKSSKKSKSNKKKEVVASGSEGLNELLEEIKRQIKNVRNALDCIYENEYLTFKRFLTLKALSCDFNYSAESQDDSAIFFKRLKEFGRALPLWFDLEGTPPPPLCGRLKAEEGYIIKDGDLVAAYVPNIDDGWILAEVISYNKDKKLYTVEDIYFEKQLDKKISVYSLVSEYVIPLPKYKAHPKYHRNALFQPSETVLALYHNCTAFYIATVQEPPSSPESGYTILFAEEEKPKEIPQRFVLNMPTGAIN